MTNAAVLGKPYGPERARSQSLLRRIGWDTICVMLSLDRQNHWREVYRTANPGWRPATEVFAALARERLHRESRVLDLGCGRGGLVEQLALPVNLVVGVDPDMVSLREHRLAALPRAAAFSDALPFVSGSFDIVTASWLLEHLDSPEYTFGEIGRVLRRGGAFVFITPNARHPLAQINRVAGRLGELQGRLVNLLYGRAEDDTFPTRYRANTSTALAECAGAGGLQLTVLHSIADPTYLAFNRPLFRLLSFVEHHTPTERRIHLVGVMVK